VWGQAEIPTARELTQLGYDAYMPLVAVRRRDPVVASMWHVVRVPLLPGYGFVRLTQTQPRERILEIRGIRELLRGADGRLAAVSDGEIDNMRADDESRLQLPKETGPALDVGTVVRVLSGPFTDFLPTVMQCDGVKTLVSVAIFGRETPVWLDRVAVVVA
jgi:transcription antitermination factor NusG